MTRRSPLTAALAAALTAFLIAPLPSCAQDGEEERLSPLDSVKATVEGAEIDVQYGRPSMRDPDTGEDRKIFGGLVSYDEVWRTGANEATHLRTSADLQIGDTRVPAGHYTLYTIPGQDEWTLIVNEQTGQWGTEYNADRDFARIPLEVDALQTTVDTFTMNVEPGDEHDGVLSLEWENTRAWAGFDVVEGDGGDDS